jgi:hypothetical protein
MMIMEADQQDYKTLSQMPNLSAADRKIVVRQLKELPPRTKAAQEKEMGEMMGKLKQVRAILSTFKTCYLLHAAWERYFEALWSLNRQLPDGQRREDRWLQHELQSRRPIRWQIDPRIQAYLPVMRCFHE